MMPILKQENQRIRNNKGEKKSPFLKKKNTKNIKNVNKSISSSTVAISLHCLKDQRKGQNCFSPVTQAQRLSTHQYTHKSDE